MIEELKVQRDSLIKQYEELNNQRLQVLGALQFAQQMIAKEEGKTRDGAGTESTNGT